MLVIVLDEEIKKIEGCEKIILISKTLSDKYGLSEMKRTIEDNYDFGGEADIWADLVTNESHYLFTWLEEEKIRGRGKQKLS